MDVRKILKDLYDGIENLEPAGNPDDFAELVRRVRSAASEEAQPFIWMWQTVGPMFGDRAAAGNIASGAMMPTPGFRQRFVKSLRDWLKEAEAKYGSGRP